MEDKRIHRIDGIIKIDVLLPELMELVFQCKRLLVKKSITPDQGREMADHVTRIRLLLSELCEKENRLMISQDHQEIIKKARETYFELEGLVKEIRNNILEK